MTEFDEEELKILQRARAVYPGGIDIPPEDQGAEYEAFVRVHKAGLIEPPVFSDRGGLRARYRKYTITAHGQEVLEQLERTRGRPRKPAPPTWEH